MKTDLSGFTIDISQQIGEPRMIVCCFKYLPQLTKKYPTRKVFAHPFMPIGNFTVIRKYPKGAFHMKVKENPAF